MTTLKVELRGEYPKDLIDVIDAVSAAKRISRTELVGLVLAEWAEKKVHEATLIHRVTRGNPVWTDSDRKAAD